MDESDEIRRLLEDARRGDSAAFGALLALYRGRLRRMVEARLDRRVRGRVDPSDVVQDAFVEATGRLDDFFARRDLPFFLWLRLVVGERILKIHRQHLETHMRDLGREISLFGAAMPGASSAVLAVELLGRGPSPADAALRAEQVAQVHEALDALEPIDREILSLRHFEELSHAEAARALGIEPAAAAKRYVRALRRIKHLLVEPGAGSGAAGHE